VYQNVTRGHPFGDQNNTKPCIIVWGPFRWKCVREIVYIFMHSALTRVQALVTRTPEHAHWLVHFVWGLHIVTTETGQKYRASLYTYGDTGWISSLYRRWDCTLRYWNIFLNMDDNKLTKCIFYHYWNNCRNNWSSDVKQIFNTLGIAELFSNTTAVNLFGANDKIRDYTVLNDHVKFKHCQN
jgi:hypothetical protein